MSTDSSKPSTDLLDKASFHKEVLHATTPVVVAFGAFWSQPCRVLQPILDEVAAMLPLAVKILKCNVDDQVDLGMLYEIQSIPTLILFVNGKESVRIVGTATKEAIIGKLRPFLPGA